MTTEGALCRWRFWMRWVLLTVAGAAVGYPVGFVLAHVPPGFAMIGASLGAGVGYMQWLALRRFIEGTGWWVLASISGLAVSLGLFMVVHLVLGYPFGSLGWPSGVLKRALPLIVGGTLIGVLQQRILRRHMGRSIWWVVASATGWGLSAIGLGIPSDTGSHNPVMLISRNLVLPAVAAGAILGVVTGGTLTWLLGPTRPQNAS